MNNASTMIRRACPICASPSLGHVIDFSLVPIHCNLLYATREDALRAPRGDVALRLCRDCGHVFNATFDPMAMAYGPKYENSLFVSPRFQDYAASLVEYLVDTYDLHNKVIIEIGCGQGDFLRALCDAGGNRGYGYDPGCPTTSPNPDRIVFISDFYDERAVHEPADLICSRHVLEHVDEPIDFLRTIRRAMGDRRGGTLFIEVPNAAAILGDLAIWDIIYEHFSYFSRTSLEYALQASGFVVTSMTETYAGQFLCAEARPRDDNATPAAVSREYHDFLTTAAADFTARYDAKLGKWQQQLSVVERDKVRAVVWGSGSKGVTFLNALEIRSEIPYVVDINSRKQGNFVAGTGQEIVAPRFLTTYRPDQIIVMNSIYMPEIRQRLDDLTIVSQVVCA